MQPAPPAVAATPASSAHGNGNGKDKGRGKGNGKAKDVVPVTPLAETITPAAPADAVVTTTTTAADVPDVAGADEQHGRGHAKDK